MTPEAQRIAIAEACGTLRWSHALPQRVLSCEVPDYLNDLNAMFEAECKFGTCIEMQAYLENLLCVVFSEPQGDGSLIETWTCCHATASQRAKAFLRTIGKWEDDINA